MKNPKLHLLHFQKVINIFTYPITFSLIFIVIIGNARPSRKSTPKTWSSRKAVSKYEEEDDNFSCLSDDFSCSETSSVVSYDDHYSSVGIFLNLNFLLLKNVLSEFRRIL